MNKLVHIIMIAILLYGCSRGQSERDTVEELLERARAERKSGKITAAKLLIDRAEELAPFDYDVLFAKAGVLVQLGQVAEADKIIDVMVSKGRDEALLCADFGMYLIAIGDKKNAARFSRRSLNTGSEDSLVYISLSICFRQLRLIRECFELELRIYKILLESPERWDKPVTPDVISNFGHTFANDLPYEIYKLCLLLGAQLRDDQYREDNWYRTMSREEIEEQLKIVQQAVEEAAEQMDKKRESKEKPRRGE